MWSSELRLSKIHGLIVCLSEAVSRPKKVSAGIYMQTTKRWATGYSALAFG